MQVSIETISNLSRKMTVGIPAERIDSAVNARLADVAKNARIDGFRPGKVPMQVVRQRFGLGARQEVLGKVINDTFAEAVNQQALRPAGMPSITAVNDKPGQVFEYVATFDVYPHISLKDFSAIEIARPVASVTDADVDAMIEHIRNQRATFAAVERAARDGDQVTINYTGLRNGEEFDGGKAEGQTLALGSKSMIPGFEDGIVGMKAGEEKMIDLVFPADYPAENLKGAAVQFRIAVLAVAEKNVPEVTEDFLRQIGVNEGGIDQFRADVRTNMERELKRVARNRVKEQVYNTLIRMHEFELPQALVDNEIRAMRQNMAQQFGANAKNLDLEKLLPAERFHDQAKQRVATGLLLNEIIVSKSLKPDAAKVRATIEEMASVYGDPQQVINYYYSQPQLLQQVEGGVLEDEAVDLVLANARVLDKPSSYQEVINNTPAA